MEGTKISFGFKMTKKPVKPVIEEKKDFIECLEEKSIKVVGGDQVEEEKPLVIPMKPNTLITAERLKEIAEKVESGLNEVMPIKEEKVDIKSEPTENETLDQMAVRELLEDAKKEVKIEQKELTVPVPAKPDIDGEKESTLDDYESVPIQDFGMAMLRGMGWTPYKEQLAKYKQPELRPKGLGLGADKVIKNKQKKKSTAKDEKDEELAIVKDSYVQIIAGKHSGYYGKVISLDEENGRVMVELAVKKETISLSEFMMQPVTKAEFDKESKVINTEAYQQYKKSERSSYESPKVKERDASSSHRATENRREVRDENRRDYEKTSNGSRDKSKQERSRRNSFSEEDRNRRRKEYKRDSSSSEDRSSRRVKEKSIRDSSSENRDRSSRKTKEKSRRDSSSEDKDRSSRKRKEKSRRDSSSEDKDKSSRKTKEKSTRDSSSEDKNRRKKDKDRKRYSSNESLDSISDLEKNKKKKYNRRRKDSSDESDSHKKEKRDIDKKRKGKKKKRDRDRSPNYRKHKK